MSNQQVTQTSLRRDALTQLREKQYKPNKGFHRGRIKGLIYKQLLKKYGWKENTPYGRYLVEAIDTAWESYKEEIIN